MKIDGEWELLGAIEHKIRERSTPSPAGLIKGIGDDCAVIEPGPLPLLISTDISIEGVHFDRSYCSPADTGYRCMAANISDIAAMGGTPMHAFVALGLPPETDMEYVLSLYDGMIDALSECGAAIAGGDLSRAPAVIVSITVTGRSPEAGPVMRGGARTGDAIYVTGFPGRSRAGMEALAAGQGSDWPVLASQHLRPRARPDLAAELAAGFSPSSMIDVSDGLVSDITHVCESSGTGFLLRTVDLPLCPDLVRFCELHRSDPVDYALSSGEEYELLFTIPKDHPAPPASLRNVRITRIGEITEYGFRAFRGGRIVDIPRSGHDHFSR